MLYAQATGDEVVFADASGREAIGEVRKGEVLRVRPEACDGAGSGGLGAPANAFAIVAAGGCACGWLLPRAPLAVLTVVDVMNGGRLEPLGPKTACPAPAAQASAQVTAPDPDPASAVAQLADFYRRHNPPLAAKAAQVLAAHTGREEELWRKLREKYAARSPESCDSGGAAGAVGGGLGGGHVPRSSGKLSRMRRPLLVPAPAPAQAPALASASADRIGNTSAVVERDRTSRCQTRAAVATKAADTSQQGHLAVSRGAGSGAHAAAAHGHVGSNSCSSGTRRRSTIDLASRPAFGVGTGGASQVRAALAQAAR